MNPAHLLLVAAGGALGSVGRHLVNVLAAKVAGPGYPWGTLGVNIVGSFAMGLVIAVLALRLEGSTSLRLFLATGVLGGFTTFSAFSLDTVALWERGEGIAAVGYVAATVVLSLTALVAGLTLARAFA